MQHFTIPYGIINIDSGGRLEKIKEKPEYDLLVNTGMYIVEKKVLKYIPRGKPFHVTDLIEVLKKKNMPIGVYPVTEKSWLDVGQWESYKEITSKLIANTGISDE
jgi:NDP-sugar pyrophosphorylase family protein